MFAYSDSLLSPYIYSNINPLNRICWEFNSNDGFGVIKHILVEDDIEIINPITFNTTQTLHLSNLYDMGFVLQNYVRIRDVYYINKTTNEIHTLPFGEYFIDNNGVVSFPEYSIIHRLYNNSNEIVDKNLYFIYDKSPYANVLNLKNADGFYIEIGIPDIYYRHTTIGQLKINFNDVTGKSFTKTYFDVDLRKYFTSSEREKYGEEIFGLGKMIMIPFYINLKEIAFSNPHTIFDLSLIESISIRISDNEYLSSSLLQYENDLSILNLPYQKIIVKSIKLYNLITDDIEEDEFGFVSSNIKFVGKNYFNYFTEEFFRIKRERINLTGLSIFHNDELITASMTLEYSDYFDLYLRFNDSLSRIPLEDIYYIPLSMCNTSSDAKEIYSLTNLHWITQKDELSPLDFTSKYYYAKIQSPYDLGTHNVSFLSIGTPLYKISLEDALVINLTVIQESLSGQEPIYLEQDIYEINYGDDLLLKGSVLDNDEILVRDQVYQYKYQEAFDGKISVKLDIIAPYGDDNFIDKKQFAIYYLDENLEKIPLYVNINGEFYIDNSIINSQKIPQIHYVNNEFIININWNTSSANFIDYDCELLVSYKMLKGHPISPLSYSKIDEFNHDTFSNLVEIPFVEYDVLNKQWKTEDNIKDIYSINNQLLYREITQSEITIQGPKYLENGDIIPLDIISFDHAFVNKSGLAIPIQLDPQNYTYLITSEGDLYFKYLNYENGDVISIGYYSYNPIYLDHPLYKENLDYIRIYSHDNLSHYHEFLPDEFNISSDGYALYLPYLYDTIIKSDSFNMYDTIEVKYHAPLKRRVDLSSSLLLMVQDEQGNYLPIDTLPIDSLGLFEYQKTFSIDDLQLPMCYSKTIVNMRLDYLPIKVFNKSKEEYESIEYEYNGDKKYALKESNDWIKIFRVHTIPKKIKLEMVQDPTQNIVIAQSFRENREYYLNRNPLEAIEEGEEYTSLQIDALVKQNYEFIYKLTDLYEDKPLENMITWMQLGFMPKSATQFLNQKAITEDGIPIYFESLGTELYSSDGPGDAPNKMFGRPLLHAVNDPENYTAYAPYIWDYGLTNEFGEVTFNVSFNQEYLDDFKAIFGDVYDITSTEDIVLYLRVFTSYFQWDDMIISNPKDYLCSKDGDVFDGSEILEEYDFTDLALHDSTYIEGIIRLHRRDIALGITDRISYKIESNMTKFDPLSLNLYCTEADPIPKGELSSLFSLTTLYRADQLEPNSINILEDNYTYTAVLQFIDPEGTPIRNPYIQDEIIYDFYYPIEKTYDGGKITISNETVALIIEDLGYGISSVRIQVLQSKYYKFSPIVNVPFEITSENYLKFGEKNIIIDLIDPFISAWGEAESGGEEMPFESNYPWLLGTIWVEPDFLGELDDKERSIQDYIDINLDCTVYNNDGTTSTFPLRQNVMLRAGNHDGIMTFSTGLGPEDSFLMGLQCDLNLSFSIDYNSDQIYEDLRDVEIILLDLRLEANPSSDCPITYWSLYDNEFFSNIIDIEIIRDSIQAETGLVTLGGMVNGERYGQEISFIYFNDTIEYSLSFENELLSLPALENIIPIMVSGRKDGYEFEFSQGIDWIQPYSNSEAPHETSLIRFIGENRPDEGTEFTITYKFEFNYQDNYFGKIILGYSNNLNQSSIEFKLPNGFLPNSSESRSPMYTRFIDRYIGTGTTTEYILDYGLEGVSNWDDELFIIYNEQELINNFGSISKDISIGHPKIIFSSAPSQGIEFSIKYGIKSQYSLSYGFQKAGKSFSDSIRLLKNDESSPQIIDPADKLLYTYSVGDPSLYISLDDFNEKTTLKLLSVPLLFNPEINLNFYFDEILLNIIEQYESTVNNALKIDFKYITNNGFYEFYSDPIILDLDYEDLSYDIVDNSYSINYNKDLSSIYDMVGTDNLDIEIMISQIGNGSLPLPYIILDQFDYLTDEHIIENYDNIPYTADGDLDVNSIIHTPHYFQIFSHNFLQGFDLINNSQVTVGLQGLPNTTLVSLRETGDGEFYFQYFGDEKTISISEANGYSIPNLGMFINSYNLDSPLYQEGYLDLYYGSGTEIDGEAHYSNEIVMQYETNPVNNYYSIVENYIPISWEETYDFTDKFLSTEQIEVTGEVFYHQLFKLTEDINDTTEINKIFDNYPKTVYFGIQLPNDLDINRIRAVGLPYSYAISSQGFPIGKNKSEYCICIENGAQIFEPSPSQYVLEKEIDYTLEYDENGTAYLLFFRPSYDLDMYTDDANQIMVDYWVNTEFQRLKDYEILENPQDPFSSQIKWNYIYSTVNSFNIHPDFTHSNTFTINYYALEWESVDEHYIQDAIDSFIFQQEQSYNVSILYSGDTSSEQFSLRYILPEGQYLQGKRIYSSIYVLAQVGDDEDSLCTIRLTNNDLFNCIEQETTNSYNYTLHFDEVNNYIKSVMGSEYELVDDSYLYIMVKYNSTLLKYPLSHTPFNYEYLEESHNAYHIGLYIDDEFISYSNESLFDEYVVKIENNFIYFAQRQKGQLGYISPQSKIQLEYKYKLQPGLLDRKHFLIITYPYSNTFDTQFGASNSSDIIYREKYRKLSGGSIISPFDYSVSINDTYSLYLSYRLNQRDYFERKFEIKAEYYVPWENGYIYNYFPDELDSYLETLMTNERFTSVNIYYFDNNGVMKFLDQSHYIVEYLYGELTGYILIKDDGNELVSPDLINKEFYISFISNIDDKEFANYKFIYDPTDNIAETIDLIYWDIDSVDGVDVFPNLDAYYYLNEEESTLTKVVCHSSQIAAYLDDGKELEFDIAGELGEYDSLLLDQIHAGNYTALYIDTNIKNLESLEYLKIELYDLLGNMLTYTQYILKEELEMYDNNIKVELPNELNSLQRIVFIPLFREDQEYSNDNDIGIARVQTIDVNDDSLSYSGNNIEYIDIHLEYDLLVNNTNSEYELAYVFNERLEHLIFPENTPIVYDTLNDDNGKILSYVLRIPRKYIDPITNETTSFKIGEILAIRYNSPVKKGISMAIGKMYFENNYHPDIEKAQLMFINADTPQSYLQFTEDYYYNIPLRPTPFDTEISGRFKAVKIDLNFTSLYELMGEDSLDFSNIVFSVPNPCYELTINEIIIVKDAYEPTSEYGSYKSRVWQYSEIEMFRASNDPTNDCYQLSLENEPLFYPNTEWIEYLNIFDEDGNYYSAGIIGDQYQLLYNQDNHSFTWNPEFNQFPEYFGMEWEEPLIIAPNKTLYFQYCTSTSWTKPIRIEQENIDLESIRVIYNYNNLLRPEHYNWYQDYFKSSHSYENIAYSFRDEVEYRVTQYYYESFTAYKDITTYTHTFDIGDLSFQDDFINVGLYKVVGLTPTFETEILTNNDNYNLNFNTDNNSLTIVNLESAGLNKFDLITVILNYSYGPISSYSEIQLMENFNETYLQDPTESFYNHVDINFNYISYSGQVLLAENSELITSDLTSFNSIPYCLNPDISIDYELLKYNSGLYDNFELYYDESSIIYEADIDFDGTIEYKHTLDLDRDGIIDVIKYGISDSENEGEIIWHTIIQNFKGYQSKIIRDSEDEVQTKWFDIDDTVFASYNFNVLKLLSMLLCIPTLIDGIASMMLPDVDYWAQKSEYRQISKEESNYYEYYSIIIDENLDGLNDKQLDYERNEILTKYEVTTFKKTILSAKYQDIYSYLGEYIERSIDSFTSNSREDLVFNEALTEDILDLGDFSNCTDHVKNNEEYLRATYRKFKENITSIYKESFTQERLTIIDFDNEGEIEEQRIYSDDFKNSESYDINQLFKTRISEHSITNTITGEQIVISFDPNLSFTDPMNISWIGETWGPDNVPLKLDSLQIIGEDYTYTTNIFEREIYIRIPNRFSLYNDYGIQSRANTYDNGYVEYLTEGIMLTPQDGQVYYSGDIKLFSNNNAKTDGHYFYVDSNLDDFYETVYILSAENSTKEDGIPIYDVISIGLNYDGIHDLVPYEKINGYETYRTDFYDLSSEKVKFGSDWIYRFGKLRNEDLLFPKEDKIWEKYKPKDHIFEIYKLVDISSNPKFSTLFYEIRHRTYSDTWKIYKDQLSRDIVEQTFIVTTTSIISKMVQSAMTASVYLAAFAQVGAMAAYFGIYTLLTKFFIDLEVHESDSINRAVTYYPIDKEKNNPISLNERMWFDRILKDSTVAALIGHPGGYYTKVIGGSPEEQYTAMLLVSPSNDNRMSDSFGGFFELLYENFYYMGESDPDTFTALDFDDINIDYFLLTNELFAYNGRSGMSHYSFDLVDASSFTYNDYRENTLGALQDMVRTASNGKFNSILPTCINGIPEYEFIDRNSLQYQGILPLSSLYRPIVVSETRYQQINPKVGHLTIKAQNINNNSSLGVYTSNLDLIESQFYEAKIPINENGFDYPIKEIYIDVIQRVLDCDDYYIYQYIEVNNSYFVIENGNLYFMRSLEDIIYEKYSNFDDLYNLKENQIYFKVHIIFDIIVPDTSIDTHRLALTQGTTYAIMDFFNQYTYASVSANMIAEIAYTETLTYWSTLISAPAAYLGSMAASAGVLSGLSSAGNMLAKSALDSLMASFKKSIVQSIFSMFITAPIKEVFQEIIQDGLIETLAESFVDFMGGTEDMAYWLSSLGTSFREITGPIGQLIFGDNSNLQTQIALIQAIEQGDIDTILEIEQRLAQEREQQIALENENKKEKSTWKKILGSNLFKCVLLAIPTIFYAPLGLGTINKIFNNIGKDISENSPKIYGKIQSKIQAYRKNKVSTYTSVVSDIDRTFSSENMFLQNLERQMKTPSELDGADLNARFRGQQEVDIDDIPICITFPEINPNPKDVKRNELADKFNEIRIGNWIKERNELIWDQVKEKEEKFETINYNIQTASKFQGFYNKRLLQLIDKYSYFDLQRLDNTLEKLSKTEYEGYIVYEKTAGAYGSINFNVLKAIFKKIDDMETLTELEREIYGVGSFIMGSPAPSFDPYSPNLHYGINDNDNLKTKSIKTLLNIIYTYQEQLVSNARNTGNQLDFTFVEGEDKFACFNQDENKITNINLAKLLGITPDIVGYWIKNIESTNIEKTTFNPQVNVFIKIKLFIETNPFYNSIKTVQNSMIHALDYFIFNDIVSSLQYIFSKYSDDSFTIQRLSTQLGMGKTYLYKFKAGLDVEEEHSKYFRLLTNVYLSNPENFNLRNIDDFKKLKEEVHDLVFKTMILQGKIKDESYRLDFDAIFYSLLALTKAKISTPEVQNGLYPLTKLAIAISPQDHRNFFTRKMVNGRIINNIQAKLMIDEIRKISTIVPEYAQLALDHLEAIIDRNGEEIKDDYIQFYWGYLYEIQVMELIRITLGLDIWGLDFIKDAVLDGQTYKMDLSRHHLEKIKSIYTIFKLENADFSENLIPFEDFVIALAPLMRGSHTQIEFSTNFNFNMQLAMHRLMHLYELIQIPFSDGIDYQSRLLSEFRSKTVMIDGQEIKIWQDLDINKINDWIDRWLLVKIKGYEVFLNDDKNGYPDFYRYRYLPIEEDYELFLQGRRPVNARLFLDENKRDKFWEWFLSVYLRDNIYPII